MNNAKPEAWSCEGVACILSLVVGAIVCLGMVALDWITWVTAWIIATCGLVALGCFFIGLALGEEG